MPQHTVSLHVTAPPDAVWDLLSNFGDLGWIPPVQQVEVTGGGPGMTRRITGTAEDPVVERLVSLDHDERRMAYSIDENNPIPVTRYEAVATVDADADACRVTWVVDYDADGSCPDEEVRGTIELIYATMATWLGEAAAGR